MPSRLLALIFHRLDTEKLPVCQGTDYVFVLILILRYLRAFAFGVKLSSECTPKKSMQQKTT
ncbi:MAG: hypothetical protein C5B47_07860 [Verrucomicrobia bacterium]|nr:MAG: hypothetical protein C5B47_07860 [Verrucomicrobiota bacterium]